VRAVVVSIFVRVELNLERVVQQDIDDPAELARLALHAMDQCAYRFHKSKDDAKAKGISDARADLTRRIAEIWPA
jgi:hypothetical protein